MFQLNARTDYGLLLMMALAESRSDKALSLRIIAEKRRLPYRFLSQIVIPLRHAGLVRSTEGLKGGYQLKKKPNRITVAEVIRAIEGELSLVPCASTTTNDCPNGRVCGLIPFWRQINQHLVDLLESITLADLIRGPSRAR